MKKEYVFVTVSLIENLKQVNIAIRKFHTIYNLHRYIVITPYESTLYFKDAFCDCDYVEIIDENKVLNKKKFNELCAEFLKVKNDHKLFRINWYYQQILKLTYTLNYKNFPGKRIIIWDADTVPLKKIKFFNEEDNPILYGSKYEYHIPYFECNNILFGKKIIYPKLSFVTQFAALNSRMRKDLKNVLVKYIKSSNITFDKYYAAKAVLHSISIKHDNEPIYGSHFSEYEFIGSFLLRTINGSRKNQKKLKFFRNYVDGKLNLIQKMILYFFDYKHITYENENYLRKKQSYRKLFKNILLDNTYFLFEPLKKFFNKKN